MRPYANMPILVLFGDFVGLSDRWSPRLKACREFVQAASKAGARAELVVLPDVGIHGKLAHADAGEEQSGDCRLAPRVDRPER